MSTNRTLLDRQFSDATIPLRKGRIFDVPASPKPDSFDFDRVEGMLLGAAIGDSLGAPTESSVPHVRAERFGEVRDYLPNRYVDDGRGYPTDDTQLTFWTVEQLIADRELVPDNVARRFCQERIIGVGSSVKGFLAAYKSGTPWHQAGPQSAGNGALMRISPVVLPHLRNGGTDLWVDAALNCPTGGDFAFCDDMLDVAIGDGVNTLSISCHSNAQGAFTFDVDLDP